MSEQEQFEGMPNSPETYRALADWLQQVLQTPVMADAAQAKQAEHTEQERVAVLAVGNGYHPTFQQQLPDFIMALLSNDSRATIHYAPLLFHLAACQDCHSCYLELYAAMREAVQPREPRPLLGQGTRTLNAMPQRMLGSLCEVLIKQAEALLYQARHEHQQTEEAARSLMQLALRVSAYITQSGIRHQALRTLVRVANLAEEAPASTVGETDVYRYTPTFSGAGGVGGKKTVRRAGVPRSARPEQPVIQLQAHTLKGSITQNGALLELHLHGLHESLRGKYIEVTVPLGSLLEPVRWLGGDPRHLHSTTTVDASGTIVMPLGETTLNLMVQEEYHLLEVMFLLLEVRAVEQKEQ